MHSAAYGTLGFDRIESRIKMEILKQIEACGIIPVVKIDTAEKAVPLAKALMDGGINVAEVTFRTDAAKEAIALITREYPEMLVGAGTVLKTEQVDDAIEAGAHFIVSPGLNPVVVEYCKKRGILIIPGCITPGEIEKGLSLGLTTLKFFPAEQAGGLPMIKALSAPFGNVKFMPTGGICLDNMASYLVCDNIIACGGSFMISDNLEDVIRYSKEAVAKVRSIRYV